jgi:hypothetical protein
MISIQDTTPSQYSHTAPSASTFAEQYFTLFLQISLLWPFLRQRMIIYDWTLAG